MIECHNEWMVGCGEYILLCQGAFDFLALNHFTLRQHCPMRQRCRAATACSAASTFHGIKFVRLLLPYKVNSAHVAFAKHFHLYKTGRADFDLCHDQKRTLG